MANAYQLTLLGTERERERGREGGGGGEREWQREGRERAEIGGIV